MVQPTLQASHEITIGFRSNILCCALQALQHQSAVASLLLYSRLDFSLCHREAFSFFFFLIFHHRIFAKKKLFSSAVFVLYNLCIRSVIDLRKKQSSSRLFKIRAETPIFPPLPLYLIPWWSSFRHCMEMAACISMSLCKLSLQQFECWIPKSVQLVRIILISTIRISEVRMTGTHV